MGFILNDELLSVPNLVSDILPGLCISARCDVNI